MLEQISIFDSIGHVEIHVCVLLRAQRLCAARDTPCQGSNCQMEAV